MRFRLFIIVEMIILLLLAMRLFVGRPGFIFAAILAIAFTALAGNSRLNLQRQIFAFVALLAWLFIIVFVITTGLFWLALIWPIVWALFFYRRHESSVQENDQPIERRFASAEPRDVTDEGQDHTVSSDVREIIDLSDLTYKSEGNLISVRKLSGDTQILVPEDVAIDLTIVQDEGLTRIFNQSPMLDAQHFHYQTDDFESFEKRAIIQLTVRVGNIEVKRV